MAAQWFIGFNPFTQLLSTRTEMPTGQLGANGQPVPPMVVKMIFPDGFPIDLAFEVVGVAMSKAKNLGQQFAKHTVVDLSIGPGPAWAPEMFTPPGGGGGG